jgi:hypothetical protein|nr:MAG TPA: hypothetical protein [Caudoviricetes sp.]
MENTGRNVVKRHQFADYLNVPQAEGTDKYCLMGTGFTSLNEEPGAQTDTKKYVNEKASSKSVTGYETVFPFESDLIPEQEPILALYNVGRNHCTGSDAEFEYVRVELWEPVSGKKNEFAARKFTVSAEISEVSGDTDIQVSGNLNAVGDPVDGTFNTETKTFTAATEATE